MWVGFKWDNQLGVRNNWGCCLQGWYTTVLEWELSCKMSSTSRLQTRPLSRWTQQKCDEGCCTMVPGCHICADKWSHARTVSPIAISLNLAHLKHCVHPRYVSSTLLSIPGHHTWLRATVFMRATPGCALCSSLRICSCKEWGMTVRRPHIRQPCSTESSSLCRKNGLSSGVVQKWTVQPFWAIARAFARTGFLAVRRVMSMTETGCLRSCTTDTFKILSSTLASFLY